jgi:hypothetical protein
MLNLNCNFFFKPKISPKKLISRRIMQPNNITRREYNGKIYVKNIRTNSYLDPKPSEKSFRIRKKSFRINNNAYSEQYSYMQYIRCIVYSQVLTLLLYTCTFCKSDLYRICLPGITAIRAKFLFCLWDSLLFISIFHLVFFVPIQGRVAGPSRPPDLHPELRLQARTQPVGILPHRQVGLHSFSQCCGSALVSVRIRNWIQLFISMRIPIQEAKPMRIQAEPYPDSDQTFESFLYEKK